jgi:hypothetical protein
MNMFIFTSLIVVTSVGGTLAAIKFMRSPKNPDIERYKAIHIPVWVNQNEFGSMLIEQMLVSAFRQAMDNSNALRKNISDVQQERLFTDFLEISHSYAEGMVRRYTEPDFY